MNFADALAALAAVNAPRTTPRATDAPRTLSAQVTERMWAADIAAAR